MTKLLNVVLSVLLVCSAGQAFAQPYLYNKVRSTTTIICFAGNSMIVKHKVVGKILYTKGYIVYKKEDGTTITTNLVCVVEEK